MLYKKQEQRIKIKEEKKLIEERKKHEEEQKNQTYLHQLEMVPSFYPAHLFGPEITQHQSGF